jgi:predicted Rossmann-fold nucleotide-binding protein
MKYKIGVFGSSTGNMDAVLPRAMQLAAVLGEHADQVIVVTGAGKGLPYMIAKEAAAKGVEIWGFAAQLNLEALQSSAPENDHDIYAKVLYVPEDFPFADDDRARMKYRNVISTASCDAGIIISGQWGTLNEFANLIDLKKTVGVMTGTGGIADELPALTQKVSKEGQGEVIFDDDPKRLVEKIISSLQV